MTTDRPHWRWLRRLGRIAGGLAIVAFGWLVVVVGLTFTAAPGRSIAIIGPRSQALTAIVVAEGFVLSSNQYVTFARADFRTELTLFADSIFREDRSVVDLLRAKHTYLNERVALQYVTFARSDDAGFVARLYAAGAILVLDADQVGGCSGRPPKPSAQS